MQTDVLMQMDTLYIVLIILVLAGIWALIELALMLRRAKKTATSLAATIDELHDTLDEARPLISKIDGMVDELQPALAQVEPLLQQTNIAVEALSADLIEVNGVLRDVSQVTGTVSSASGAVSHITSAASEKIQHFIDKVQSPNSADQATGDFHALKEHAEDLLMSQDQRTDQPSPSSSTSPTASEQQASSVSFDDLDEPDWKDSHSDVSNPRTLSVTDPTRTEGESCIPSRNAHAQTPSSYYVYAQEAPPSASDVSKN